MQQLYLCICLSIYSKPLWRKEPCEWRAYFSPNESLLTGQIRAAAHDAASYPVCHQGAWQITACFNQRSFRHRFTFEQGILTSAFPLHEASSAVKTAQCHRWWLQSGPWAEATLSYSGFSSLIWYGGAVTWQMMRFLSTGRGEGKT